MFLKPFRIKTQTAIKGSDRKRLRAELSRQFSSIDGDVLGSLVPGKEEMATMKIFTHSGQTIVVYILNKNPVFFTIEGIIYPTVYTLWEHPDMMPVFTTWPPVLKKIAGGADLMLPGVVVKGTPSPEALGGLRKGCPCAVKLVGNKCPVAVGETAMSSADMVYDAGMRGKGVIMLHAYGDHLWAHGDKSHPPVLEDPDYRLLAESEEEDDIEDEQYPSLSGEPGASGEAETVTVLEKGQTGEAVRGGCADSRLSDLEKLRLEDEQEVAEENEEGEEEEEEDPLSVQERMDSLLHTCFKCAIKLKVKKTDLPLLTSKFFKVYVQGCCPVNQSIDIKKTSYKKLSKFLKAMQKEDFVHVKELSKGVESIIFINKAHRELSGLALDCETVADAEASAAEAAAESEATFSYQPPVITPVFLVSGNTQPLFRLLGVSKGSALKAEEVRKFVTDYIKNENVQKDDLRGLVTLDAVLAQVLLNKGEYVEQLPWEELFSRCQARMNPAHQVAFPGQRVQLCKGKLEPVTLNVATRAGNKKVTLVENLETYGIDAAELGRAVQVGGACSTSVSQLPGKNQGQQLLVQGNQINYIAKLLTEKYQLEKKWLQGLDKAPKSGKKRR